MGVALGGTCGQRDETSGSVAYAVYQGPSDSRTPVVTHHRYPLDIAFIQNDNQV